MAGRTNFYHRAIELAVATCQVDATPPLGSPLCGGAGVVGGDREIDQAVEPSCNRIPIIGRIALK